MPKPALAGREKGKRGLERLLVEIRPEDIGKVELSKRLQRKLLMRCSPPVR
jgi:hypothetical protein